MLCICIAFMQTTSQSLVTQLTKPKMFFDASKLTHQKLVSRSTKKTMILHAGHNSQPSPVTTINGYTLKICNDSILASQLKRLFMWFRKKLVGHGLQSANSGLFSFQKSVMLTRCTFLRSRLKQLQHMDWNQSP